MAKKKNKTATELSELRALIGNLVDAARADEMKGGGDPLDVPEITLRFELAVARVNAAIDKLEREFG